MRTVVLLLSSLVLAACGSMIPAVPLAEYTFVQLLTGSHTPASQEESQAVFGGHMANIQRLAHEGVLVLAGPYGAVKSEPSLRGVFVLATGDRAMAQQLAESDPAFQAKVFRFEFAAMATTADLRGQLAAELAREEAKRAAGQTPKLGDGMRSYVLLTASTGAAAAAVVSQLAAALLVGRLDDDRLLVLLDAVDVAAANVLLEPVKAQLGAFTLDEWWSSDLLTELPKRAGR